MWTILKGKCNCNPGDISGPDATLTLFQADEGTPRWMLRAGEAQIVMPQVERGPEEEHSCSSGRKI